MGDQVGTNRPIASKAQPSRLTEIEEQIARTKNSQIEINERLNSMRSQLIGPILEEATPPRETAEKPSADGTLHRLGYILEDIEEGQARTNKIIDQLVSNLMD